MKKDAETLIAWVREAADELEKSHAILDELQVGRKLPGSVWEYTLAARIALLAE